MFICCPHPSGLAEIRAAAHGTWLHLEPADRGEITPLTNYMNLILFSQPFDTTSFHFLLATFAFYVPSSVLLLRYLSSFFFLFFFFFFFSSSERLIDVYGRVKRNSRCYHDVVVGAIIGRSGCKETHQAVLRFNKNRSLERLRSYTSSLSGDLVVERRHSTGSRGKIYKTTS